LTRSEKLSVAACHKGKRHARSKQADEEFATTINKVLLTKRLRAGPARKLPKFRRSRGYFPQHWHEHAMRKRDTPPPRSRVDGVERAVQPFNPQPLGVVLDFTSERRRYTCLL
jgi:hypothetical protein